MLESVGRVLERASAGDWLLLAGGVLLLLYVLGTWNFDFFSRRGLPSSRPRFPFAGDMWRVFAGLQSFPDGIENMYRKGHGYGLFGLFEVTNPLLFVRDPEMIKMVAVKDFDHFVNHRSFATVKTDPLFAKNLFNLKDQHWREMRATLSPTFTTSKIKVMIPLISQCAEQLSQHLREKYRNSKEAILKQPLATDMKDLFSRMTNDVIATTAFGVSCDSFKSPNNEFYKMGKTITTFSKWRTIVIFALLIAPKLVEFFRIRILDGKATDFFDTLVKSTMKERQKRGIVRPDMLQLMMQARAGQLQESKEDAAETEDVGPKKKQLDDDDITAQALIFFFAGYEAVSTAMCLTTHILSHHLDIQRRLQAEIDNVMSESGGKPTYECLQKMKYLDAVVNESLRLNSPTPATDRVCQKDITLTDEKGNTFAIPKGTVMQIPVVGIHHDSQYWEDPYKFDPERFMEENKHKIKPFTYMPFGLGPRVCIAQRFALVELKLALVYLLSTFDLHPCAKTKHPLEYMPRANLIPKGGYWCCLIPRDP